MVISNFRFLQQHPKLDDIASLVEDTAAIGLALILRTEDVEEAAAVPDLANIFDVIVCFRKEYLVSMEIAAKLLVPDGRILAPGYVANVSVNDIDWEIIRIVQLAFGVNM